MSTSTDISALYREFTEALTEVLAENAVRPARRGRLARAYNPRSNRRACHCESDGSNSNTVSPMIWLLYGNDEGKASLMMFEQLLPRTVSKTPYP